jgi:hypothetical protein
MAKRKTFEVETFLKQINEMLKLSKCDPEGRKTMQVILESVLMETGNYKGYRYLTANEVPAGHLPGINISPIDGQHLEDMVRRFEDTDSSRVCYFS